MQLAKQMNQKEEIKQMDQDQMEEMKETDQIYQMDKSNSSMDIKDFIKFEIETVRFLFQIIQDHESNIKKKKGSNKIKTTKYIKTFIDIKI